MDEKLKFIGRLLQGEKMAPLCREFGISRVTIGRLLQGEKMAPLCREFGISRVTGYKIYNRYKDCGLDGLYDRSRAPYRQANKLPYQVERAIRAILGIKKEHPSWGAPKIRAKLIRDYPMIPTPAVSTIHAVLDRNNLVKRRKRKRHKAKGTTLVGSETPNGLWCADYKGEFLLGNHQYCYPLTISDYRSRYLLACDGLESTKSDFAFSVFERTFKSSACPSSRYGGCASASISSASSPDTPSRMGVTNAYISRSSRRPPSRPRSTSCSSRNASTTSWRFTTMSGRTRRSATPTRAKCIHLQRVSMRRPRTRTTRITTALSE
jgi:hypothetical protein